MAPQPSSSTDDEPEWFKRYRLAQEEHNNRIVETLEILARHLGVEILSPLQSQSAREDDGTHTATTSGDDDGTASCNDEDGTHAASDD